jgi:hypothetical protein
MNATASPRSCRTRLRTATMVIATLLVTLLSIAAVADPAARVVVIGASVSDGFGVRLRTAQADGRSRVVGVNLSTILRAAARDPSTQVTSHATFLYFQDPSRAARESVRRTIAERPSMVLAVDWMFWNAYGTSGVGGKQIQGCEDRVELLEDGLRALAPLADSGVPLVLGDLPDMQDAVGGGMLSAPMVPDPGCLTRLNARIRAWCAERPNVMLVDLSDVVRRVLDGKPVRACNRDWCEADLGPLLQRDRLHPTLNGTLAVLAAALDRADRGTDGAASRAFDLDPGTIRERIAKVCADAPEAPAVSSPSAAPPAPPAAAGSGSTARP